MKIFFYEQYLTEPSINAFTIDSVNKHNLHQQFNYFNDIYQELKKYRTENPNDADYFFLPIFLAAFQFENKDPFSLFDFNLKFIGRGRHLLVGTGDFGQRSQSLSEMQSLPSRAYRDKYAWLDDRFIILALESTKDLHATDLSFFPYMIDDQSLDNDNPPQKTITASFMGRIHYPELPTNHIRGGSFLKLYDFYNSEGLFLLDSTRDAVKNSGITSRQLMQHSEFTLCPAGYGQWSYRLIESIRNNSIPIILADDYIFPFGETIPWLDFCIKYSTKDILQLPDFIKSMPASVKLQYQTNLNHWRHFFTRENCLKLLTTSLRNRVEKNDINWALPRMRSPSEMGIICIDITNKCDLACSNCTRLLENQKDYWEMTLDNFRLACNSLKNYTGVIAIIGGNPCMHSQFEKITEIFCEVITNKHQRGIWTNNAFKHLDRIRNNYGAFNLNPHGVERGIKSLRPLRESLISQKGVNVGYYEDHSEHSPLLVACKDILPENKMWQSIVNCDINKNWSASIVQNNGKLRAYFCEVAASFDLAWNRDTGIPVYLDWWKEKIDLFSTQINTACPGCGSSMRLTASFDYEETDTYSPSNETLAINSQKWKKRKIIPINFDLVNVTDRPITKYNKDAL